MPPLIFFIIPQKIPKGKRNGKKYMDETKKAKRKTKTSTEVTQRYQKKTYEHYAVRFRKVEDADCIDYMRKEREKGYTPSEIFKKLIRGTVRE